MSKKVKPNQPEDAQEKNYSSGEMEAVSESADSRKKKPLLERLGLVEPILKQDDNDELSPFETELSITFDPKPAIGVENHKTLDREDRVVCEKLSIKEVFSKFGLESSQTNTIYLIESFIKALPANLPADVKRQSIINIISASQLDVASLIKDGSKRVEVLKKYSQDFSNSIDEIIDSNQKQIHKLNERIAHHNKIINENQSVKEDQKAAIEFEIQKLSNIIEFIENRAK